MRKARKKRLTKAEKENAILINQVNNLIAEKEGLSRAATYLERKYRDLETVYAETLKHKRDSMERLQALEHKINDLYKMAASFTSDRKDITLERHFGRVEGTIRSMTTFGRTVSTQDEAKQ